MIVELRSCWNSDCVQCPASGSMTLSNGRQATEVAFLLHSECHQFGAFDKDLPNQGLAMMCESTCDIQACDSRVHLP